jgi:hypothetical protein
MGGGGAAKCTSGGDGETHMGGGDGETHNFDAHTDRQTHTQKYIYKNTKIISTTVFQLLTFSFL